MGPLPVISGVISPLLINGFVEWVTGVISTYLYSLSQWTLKKKSLNFIFPTKYVILQIPKSLKFSHWLSEYRGPITPFITVFWAHLVTHFATSCQGTFMNQPLKGCRAILGTAAGLGNLRVTARANEKKTS